MTATVTCSRCKLACEDRPGLSDCRHFYIRSRRKLTGEAIVYNFPRADWDIQDELKGTHHTINLALDELKDSILILEHLRSLVGRAEERKERDKHDN
jgi:hypothetical protein